MSAVEILQRRAAAAADTRAARAEQNRKAMPECARILDDVRSEFGDDAVMVTATENGKSMGNPDWWKRVGINEFQPDNRMCSAADVVLRVKK